jgi:hypothetical protein
VSSEKGLPVNISVPSSGFLGAKPSLRDPNQRDNR